MAPCRRAIRRSRARRGWAERRRRAPGCGSCRSWAASRATGDSGGCAAGADCRAGGRAASRPFSARRRPRTCCCAGQKKTMKIEGKFECDGGWRLCRPVGRSFFGRVAALAFGRRRQAVGRGGHVSDLDLGAHDVRLGTGGFLLVGLHAAGLSVSD